MDKLISLRKDGKVVRMRKIRYMKYQKRALDTLIKNNIYSLTVSDKSQAYYLKQVVYALQFNERGVTALLRVEALKYYQPKSCFMKNLRTKIIFWVFSQFEKVAQSFFGIRADRLEVIKLAMCLREVLNGKAVEICSRDKWGFVQADSWKR